MGYSIGFVHTGVRTRYIRRGGRKSDFAWNFLISKGPEKKSNAAIEPVTSERMKSSRAIKARVHPLRRHDFRSLDRSFCFSPGIRETSGKVTR